MHSVNFTIDLTMIPYDIMVFYNEKDDNVSAILLEVGINKYEVEHMLNLKDEEKGRTMITTNNYTIIRLKAVNEDILPGIIAHESLHAISMIMEQMGVKFHPDFSEEIYTYALQYVVNKMHYHLEGRLK
jgi:hypothetical protein